MRPTKILMGIQAKMNAILEEVRKFWTIYKQNKIGYVGFLIIGVASIIALIGPHMAPYDPYEFSGKLLGPPSSEHILGTDSMGRDLLSRIIYGIRISMAFAVIAASVSATVGIILGAMAGYYGGLWDDLLSRIFDFFLMIPRFFLIILIVAMFGTNILYTMVVVGLTVWPSNARIIRSQVLSLKSRAFVHAAIGIGASNFRVVFKHILPNGLYPIVVNSAMQMAYAILLEASLSFLGLGDPNLISLGQILYGAQQYVRNWWISIFPGITIALIVLGFHILGDGVNYVYNPRMRRKTLATP